MNLAFIPFTAVPLVLYFADKFGGAPRPADATRSAEAGFSALVAARQKGVNLATKSH
jgi:hypothetical protein